MQAGPAALVARFTSAIAREVLTGFSFAVATIGVVAALVFFLTRIIIAHS